MDRSAWFPRLRPGRRAIWALSGLAAALVAALVLLAGSVPFSSKILRDRIVKSLSDKLDAEVTLRDLSLRLFPRMSAVGSGLLIRQRERGEAPPLITVERFVVQADLIGLLRKHVGHVELEGLDIEVPPGRRQDDGRQVKAPGTPAPAIGTVGADDRQTSSTGILDDLEDGVVVDRMDSRNARLALMSSKPHKAAKIWNIHTLHMERVGIGRSMPFRATLTNGIPRGEIETQGHFGPWQAHEPGDTPLDGTYVFDNADLSVFKGISGRLSSTGAFGGTLDRIEAQGDTETPDFTLTLSGQPFLLRASYRSIIDGTNGDTILERIDASFLETSLVASGAVVDDSPGVKGRTVRLDVEMERGRIEDIMKMAVRAETPPMTGALRLNTSLVLPPGDADVPERLQLEGQFAIGSATFTNYDVQGKIQELSSRGRGRQSAGNRQSVVSNFSGQFRLAGGILSLPVLQFQVPGAAVRLAGRYALRPETLDFKGQLLLDAKVSELTTGLKSLLLRAVDPLFRQRDGTGSAIPIKIGGRREAPEFGLDLGRVLKKR